jgi:hypothetical protein
MAIKFVQHSKNELLLPKINYQVAAKKIVKASFRDCPLSDRSTFKESKCIMPISIGQPVHESDKFKATIELVNRSFKSCVILIDDSVQRHTFRITDTEFTEDELYEYALKQGDLWYVRNRNTLNSLTIPYEVIRWDKWLFHPKFNQYYNAVNNLYNTDCEYKSALDANIIEYLTRLQERIGPFGFNYEQGFNLCLAYLKEECAGMCLWVEEECEFELYPSGRNKAMTETYNKLIKSSYPNLLKSVALRFKKYPSKSENPYAIAAVL